MSTTFAPVAGEELDCTALLPAFDPAPNRPQPKTANARIKRARVMRIQSSVLSGNVRRITQKRDRTTAIFIKRATAHIVARSSPARR
jgi:hypothetical protein